jgi:hypothetical protein
MPSDIELARTQQQPGRNPGQARVQRVRKFFSEPEAIEALKAAPVHIRIGNPAFETRDVTIYPLTPGQFAVAYSTLKDVLLPVLDLFKPGEAAPQLPQIMDVLGDKVSQLPKLIHTILQRSPNPPSEDWLNSNMDFLLDLQLIIPPFIAQNGLEKLFGGGNAAPPLAAQQTEATESANHTDLPTVV